MTAIHRRILFAAALVAGFAAFCPGEDVTTGSVNGEAAEAFIRDIQGARDLGEEARALLEPYLANGDPVPQEVRDSVSAKLQEAASRITVAVLGISENSSEVRPGVAPDVMRDLNEVVNGEATVSELLQAGKLTAPKVEKLMQVADALMKKSQFALMGIPIGRKDEQYLSGNPPPPTAAEDPDIKSRRNGNKVTKKDIAGGRGDSLRGRGRARRQPRPRRGSDKAKVPGDPPNYFYSFTGTSSTETGYLFKTLDRPLFGPFEVKFQVGAFDPEAEGDTGSACVEFDIEGSAPLQFLAVCGRRVSGGVQVFAQSHDGAAGNLFLPGARIAQVRVFYDGTTFTCSAAGGAGAPDETLVDFATYGLVQGGTALLPGIGASGLLKGAEIGLDEIYFTAK